MARSLSVSISVPVGDPGSATSPANFGTPAAWPAQVALNVSVDLDTVSDVDRDWLVELVRTFADRIQKEPAFAAAVPEVS